MRGSSYRPATSRDLIRLLRLDRSRRHEFKRLLRDLLNDDQVVKVGHDRYALPGRAGREPGRDSRQGRREDGRRARGAEPARAVRAARERGQPVVAGRLQRHARGFGFVTRDTGGPDVFIPPRALGDLLDGDRVAIRIVREDGGGRAEGEIVRLLERSRKRVLGVYRSAGRRHGGTVQAYDRQFETGIVISEEDVGRAEDGLVVGVEILRPPRERHPAAGRIVETLGRPDEP